MKKLLFVDDDPNILKGLGRLLHCMRAEWSMEFAESGPQALEMLSRESFDVVVSDMRMPGMDGAQLLSEVMVRYPQTVRIILSGQSDHEFVLRSVGPTHQFLSKPCDPQVLQSVVARACTLRDLVASESLRKTISKVRSLPSPPGLYLQLVEELKSDQSSLQRVGEIISGDVGMSTKVLQLVNSAFFGLPRHLSTPAEAACYLGVETIKALVLSINAFSQLKGDALGDFSIDWLFEHSLATGRLAREIAQAERATARARDEAMMAGMLHDVGQLVLATELAGPFLGAVRVAEHHRIPMWKAELEALGASHAEVGAYLLGLWGLPQPIVEAVAYHHQPGVPLAHSRCEANPSFLAAWVHAADALLGEARDPRSPGVAPALDLDCLRASGLADRVPVWRELAASVQHGGIAA
jgi:HD-like signal output (HDOD) protein/CheY-like chemotaxis protein